MLYVTGDTHGGIDFAKILAASSGKLLYPKLTANDYLIVLGDFGYIWYPPSDSHAWIKHEQELDWLEKQPYTLLFIDGNHENFDLLNAMPVEKWNGGNVHFIRSNVIHLMRGQVYTIEGKTLFTFGGATSIDKQMRVEGISWWSAEMPNYAEIEEGMQNLDKVDWKVDYVLTHETANRPAMRIIPYKKADFLSNYFDELANRLEFKKWYFGHYHVDKDITDKYSCLYQGVVPIGESVQSQPNFSILNQMHDNRLIIHKDV